jgi:hypothetical protein
MEVLHWHLTDFAVNFGDFSHHLMTVSAQAFDDIDILRDLQEAWEKFVATGQCWALLIGLIVGYGFKGLTNY